MKHLFTAALFLLVLGYSVFGQTSNAPALKIESPDIVAEINGDKITRSSLAAECLQLHGKDVLQDLINKTLIKVECERQKISITSEEINAEVLRMAKTFNMTSEDWLKLLEERRGISPEQYRQDIVWKILALGKLAGMRLVISEAELQEAYDSQYGPAVQVRQIVLATKAGAEATLAELKQHPDTFASVAKNRSIDPTSQPYSGMLHPIRRNTFDPHVERILFAMKPGDISPVMEFPMGHFSIFRCEAHLQPIDVDFAAVKEQLYYQMRDVKLRQVADEVFMELQRKAQVQIVLDDPTLYTQYPGVAALLNGQKIPQKELADACVQKHGKEVLGDMLNRRLIEQACKRENIIISERDVDEEIREMAFKHLPLLPGGAADVNLWLKRATDETGLSVPMYRKNAVVPMLALKRLTRQQIQVTEEDVRRSFEANYGEKVRCLAIFFGPNDQRRAQEVWQKANRVPKEQKEQNFSELAEQYSYDPELRLGKGVIPPIARHCGHPELEKEAFSLEPGELSQIVQNDEHLVILYCLGRVEPLPVKIEDVRVDIIADLFEKKQQIIMAMYFEKLCDQAVFENYLTGESQNPTLEKAKRVEENQTR